MNSLINPLILLMLQRCFKKSHYLKELLRKHAYVRLLDICEHPIFGHGQCYQIWETFYRFGKFSIWGNFKLVAFSLSLYFNFLILEVLLKCVFMNKQAISLEIRKSGLSLKSNDILIQDRKLSVSTASLAVFCLWGNLAKKLTILWQDCCCYLIVHMSFQLNQIIQFWRQINGMLICFFRSLSQFLKWWITTTTRSKVNESANFLLNKWRNQDISLKILFIIFITIGPLIF